VSAESELLLGVNIDHVATIRQARGTRYPDPVYAAMEAERAGADLITLHLREDRRHIQERDVRLLKEVALTRVNLEMAVTEEMLAFAERTAPQDCCLVPERREELTTEGGLDVAGMRDRVAAACARLGAAGARVSLFVDAESEQVRAAADARAPAVEIHTGAYADAPDADSQAAELERIRAAAELGRSLGLKVNAGHGLSYQNVAAVARIGSIRELNIGHAIVARALFTGMGAAVADMKRLMLEARR